MELYAEMDMKIVGLLRLSGDPLQEYAATLIGSLRDHITKGEKRVQAALAKTEECLTSCIAGDRSPDGCKKFCDYFGCQSIRDIRDALKT